MASPLRPRILVVNSSSNDGTVSLARQLGVEVLSVPRDEFNHGTTREMARRHLRCDITVMLTPDAHAVDSSFIERLVMPLLRGHAAMAYARQLPRSQADPLERFNREFNYPPRSALRGPDAYRRLGNSAHFCSNSAAAWLDAALDDIGGFEETLVSEETLASVRLLRAGYRVAYIADAQVVHSHPSSLWGDLRRQFDIGYGRAMNASLLLAEGNDERRGMLYLHALMRYLWQHAPALLPKALLNVAVRYLGYRMGLAGPSLPRILVRKLSGQDFYWTSKPLLRARQALRRAA